MSYSVKKDNQVRLDPLVLQQKVYSGRLSGQRLSSDLFDFSTLERIEIEYVSVDDLRPNSWNPNRMTEREFDLLCLSIEEDGFTVPVLVNKDNRIIDGEHRWRAAVSLGFSEIPVVRVFMGEVQMRISTIRHNIARGSNVGSLEAIIYQELSNLGGLDWGKHSLLLEDVDLESFKPSSLPELCLETAPVEVFIDSSEEVFSDEVDPNALPEFESFMTKQAQRLQHMREEMLPRAKTKEEREKIKREMVIYRLALAFSGEEAHIIREVLGDDAAERVLSLCRKEFGDDNGSDEPRGRSGEDSGNGEKGC